MLFTIVLLVVGALHQVPVHAAYVTIMTAITPVFNRFIHDQHVFNYVLKQDVQIGSKDAPPLRL